MAQSTSALPARMRGLVFSEYGPAPEKLSVQEMDVPQPGENEVLIRVHAASVNPLDYKIIGGYLQQIMPLTFPKATGYDVSGVIVALGEGVDAETYHVGDAVMGQTGWPTPYGSMVEYTCVSTAQMGHKPENISFEEAAAAPCVTATSYQAFTKHSHIVAGESNVMVLGGSSATGMQGIQLAKILGAKFVGTTSSQEELCKSLGADVVVNYREADWTQELSEMKFDIIYDCVGEASYDRAVSVMKDGSIYVVLVGEAPAEQQEGKEWKRFLQVQTESYGDYIPMLADGRLRIVLDERSPYSWDSVVDMFRDLMSKSAHGKLVVKLSE